VDYYQGVVTNYLRADRAVFVNTECCVQLNPGANPDTSGPHWYCDAVAVDFRESAVYLCEISYSRSLAALLKRLDAWNVNWLALRAALVRDSFVPKGWPVQPWVFIPAQCRDPFDRGLSRFHGAGMQPMPKPKVTSLEDVVPWKYPSWNRLPEAGAESV
jgi:hypothetical protein